jgi:uncharacterized protein YfaS (alpha-2-macroglobulin family)
MRAGRILALLAVAALSLGLFSATALAGKKKRTTVVFFSGSPKVNGAKNVTAKGTLSTANACKPARGMKLSVLDANGVILATLDGSTSDANGNWKLQGQLPSTLPAGPKSLQVKASKRVVGKFVCRAGFSPLVPIA